MDKNRLRKKYPRQKYGCENLGHKWKQEDEGWGLGPLYEQCQECSLVRDIPQGKGPEGKRG